MIQLHVAGVQRLLGFLASVRENSRIEGDDVKRLLEDETWQQFIRAYSRFEGFTREGLIRVLLNLGKPEPVGEGAVLRKLEEGFRSAMDPAEIEVLRRRLERVAEIDFGEAERVALRFLPEGTSLDLHIHFTIDAFNMGMVFENHVFFDLCRYDPERISLPSLSHEFHHVGAKPWLKQSRALRALYGTGDPRHRLLAEILEYLVSEGLANCFCSPEVLRSEHPRISRLRREWTTWLGHLTNILEELLSPEGDADRAAELLRELTIDLEAVLPAGHYLSGRMVMGMEKAPNITREQIIQLVKSPERFLELYNQAAEAEGHPSIPQGLIQQLDKLIIQLTP